jgi:predicted kinase
MKDKIKEILRENVDKNILGVSVTRPNQELIIMRGVPGAGKSTKAKSLVGQGKIHSTDDLIEKSGDYREFFANMIAKGDFSALSKMHSQNLKDAIASMKAGVTPVIIDNTCLRVREMSDYIKAAFELGYSDDNIQIVDVDSSLSVEDLAERNTHGVPLDKIKQMMQTKKSVGTITLEMVVKYINKKGS